jgi:solute carrier family 25 carnitine/acylcarnitine transporter 20/29
MSSTTKSFWNDILAGSACGVTTVLLSHPLETLLTQRKINSPDVYRNFFHSVQLIYKRQGLIDGFYRGNLNLPLISPAFLTATQFFLYGRLTRYLVKDDDDAISKYMLAGALTGFGLSFIETPIGLVLGQIHGNLNRRHTHVFDFHIKDCCKYIYQNSYGLFGFYRGFISNVICSMTTSMFYFGGYEYVRKHLYQRHNRIFGTTKKDKHLRLNILFSGAIGGLGAWSICYPLDIIRSEIQTDDLRPGRRKYTSYFDCIKQIYEQENSLKTFYRGFFPGILKAVPINAACFLAYEEVYRLLE